MKIYNYNPENGYFVGESFADESPLEPGVYLIPAFATEIPALKATKGKVVVFVNGDWELQDLPKQPVIDNSEFEAQQAQKQAILEKLGLTSEEASLLLS
jgi:hypothetical protein